MPAKRSVRCSTAVCGASNTFLSLALLYITLMLVNDSRSSVPQLSVFQCHTLNSTRSRNDSSEVWPIKNLVSSEDRLQAAVNNSIAYWRARAPLHRINLNEDDEGAIAIVNQTVWYKNASKDDRVHVWYRKALSLFVADWVDKGWEPANCIFGTALWDLDHGPEFQFEVLTAFSRRIPSRAILVPNFYIMRQISEPDCGAKEFKKFNFLHNRTSWDERKGVPIWRGSFANGQVHLKARKIPIEIRKNITYQDHDFSPRPYLIRYSLAHPEEVDAKWHRVVMFSPRQSEQVIELVGGEEEFMRRYGNKDYIPPDSYFSDYKYPIVIHGWGAAYRLWKHFASGQCVLLHQSMLEEWFYPMLEPFIHYVPLKNDLSDLRDVLSWVKNNPAKTKEIAQNGRKFYEEYLTFEGISKYLHKIFQELTAAESKTNISKIVKEKFVIGNRNFTELPRRCI